MTAVFYVALHELRAFFLDHGIRLGDHEATRKALRKNLPRTQQITRHYSRLYGWSIEARYKGAQPAQQKLRRAEQSLQTIRHEVARLTAQHQPLTPP